MDEKNTFFIISNTELGTIKRIVGYNFCFNSCTWKIIEHNKEIFNFDHCIIAYNLTDKQVMKIIEKSTNKQSLWFNNGKYEILGCDYIINENSYVEYTKNILHLKEQFKGKKIQLVSSTQLDYIEKITQIAKLKM